MGSIIISALMSGTYLNPTIQYTSVNMHALTPNRTMGSVDGIKNSGIADANAEPIDVINICARFFHGKKYKGEQPNCLAR